MFIISNNDVIKCASNLLQLEHVMICLKSVMNCESIIRAMNFWNKLCIHVIINNYYGINFCNGKKINSVLMYIMSNHNGKKLLSSLLQLEPCIKELRVIFVHNGTL